MMDEKNPNTYYRQVADYYSAESEQFENHYLNNPILQRIRSDFRRLTEQFPFASALEIGYGPGLDLAYFAEKYPQRCIRGIDVSPGMWQKAQENLRRFGGSDVRADLGTTDDLSQLYPGQKFDLIYCYYGALNTVIDLQKTAQQLAACLAEDGMLVLTFVNRWFLFEIIWNLLRLRFRKSLARLRRSWPGYSPERPLASRCRSASEIKQIFSRDFILTGRKGYSIVFPAWYRHRFIDTTGRLGQWLWHVDQVINRTPFWNLGEYSLYLLKPKMPQHSGAGMD